MNRFKAIGLPTIIASIILFILGQLVFVRLFEFFEPEMPGISFVIIEQDSILKASVLFSLTLALAPVLLSLIWSLAPIVTIINKITSGFIILIFIATAILVRHYAVKTYFTRIVRPAFLEKDTPDVSYPIDPVNFVYYILGGLCMGCVVAFFLFRKKSHLQGFNVGVRD